MMESPSPADTTPLESTVSMPPSVRAVLYTLLVFALALSLHSCFQAAVMIYDFHQTLQWVGEVTER